MPSVRSISLGVWVRAGSGNETPENNGIAHFLEHMLFKGSHSRTAKEIAQSLESRGGGLNGATGKEISSYTAHILDQDLPLAVDVLSDLILNPRFDPSDINIEKQVVLAEMANAGEDPEELILDHFYQNLYPNHPLGYFIYGTEKNIRQFERPSLDSFLNHHYTTENTVVAAAGNVRHDQLVELVERYFSSTVPAQPPAGSSLQMQSPASLSQHRMKNLQQTHICIGVRLFGFKDQRRYALALLDTLLGGGMSSRLFQNIREKYGFTYSVFSFADLMADTGVFGAYLACEKRKSKESLELLQEEFLKLQQGHLAEEELALAKSQVIGNMVLSLESSGRRMKKIGETEIYDCPHISIDQSIENINRVSTADIIDLMQQFYTPSNTNTTILSP